jgi:DNA repair protein RadD
MIQLRSDQIDCLNSVWNHILHNQTALVVTSTGSGKGVVIHELLRRSLEAKPDIKCLVLFNRVTLLSQLAERFRLALGRDRVGIYCGTEGQWDTTRPITVGSIQSLDPAHLNFNLIIIDEVHNLDEEKGRYAKFIKHQMAQNPKTKVVGFTATDFRFNGYIHGKGKLFSHPCFKRGLKFYIDRGLLVPPIAKQPDFQIDLSKLRILKGEYRQDDIDAQTMNEAMAKDQVADALNRMHERKKVVWFCSSINHAELINSLLNSSGEDSVTLHSKMDWDARDLAEDRFMRGPARHLTSVSVVAEGWDYPPADCLVLMRPTRSPGLMIQICGRVLRTFEGKQDALLLDYGNVISSLGPLDDPVVGKKKKGEKGEPPRQKTCPDCRTYIAPRVMTCPQCGFNWPKAEATKIALTPDEEAAFFTKKILTMEVDHVTMTQHISKAGNANIKITYLPKNIFTDGISEYFQIENDWSHKRFILRAIDLGIAVKPTLEEQVVQEIKRKPTAIDYVLESKYPRIKKLNFVPKGM